MKGWPGEPDMEHDVLVAQGPAAAADGKPISNVIFDFGNVLIYWDPSVVLLPRYSQETIDQFLDNDISGFYDANDRMDGGASPDEGVAWMVTVNGQSIFHAGDLNWWHWAEEDLAWNRNMAAAKTATPPAACSSTI